VGRIGAIFHRPHGRPEITDPGVPGLELILYLGMLLFVADQVWRLLAPPPVAAHAR